MNQRMDRREALKWVLAATTTVSVLPGPALAAPARSGRGYTQDPDLLREYQPGELWPLTFTEQQRRTVAALCDVIIPADDKSPAASTVGVPDFIDEWISAPYSEQQADKKLVLQGLAWLERESKKRFRKPFGELEAGARTQICDDICLERNAKPEFKVPAKFFARFRDLTAGGFYTTPAGWKDLQYLGNVALKSFDGPPPEVLRHLGLA